MRDYDIREVLTNRLCAEHDQEPDTLVLHELGVCQGLCRVDLAVINGVMTGYEIKSDRDTLERLPQQMKAYSMVLDFVTIVVGTAHLDKAIKLVPNWWGVMTAKDVSGVVSLEFERQPKKNPNIDPFAVAEFLWREEALEILVERGWERGIKSKPRQVLWQRLVERLELEELQEIVRQTLKSRANWRADLVQTQSGARIPHIAN